MSSVMSDGKIHFFESGKSLCEKFDQPEQSLFIIDESGMPCAQIDDYCSGCTAVQDTRRQVDLEQFRALSPEDQLKELGLDWVASFRE